MSKLPTSAIVLAIAVFIPINAAVAQDDLNSVAEPTATVTFESIGIIMAFDGDDNQDSSCSVEYRKIGGADWEIGHELWVDHRTLLRASREFRGSLVHLEPGASYEIRLTYTDPDGGGGTKEFAATTWDETFPEGEVIEVTDRTTPLVISDSGTETGYRVYSPPSGQSASIDVQNAHDNNIVISANYVIVRGLNLVGSSGHGIEIDADVHDVIIEDCDISNWGPSGIGSEGGWSWHESSGIMANPGTARIIIQNNTIHHPRGGANSWENGSEPWQTGEHPAGPQPISFRQTAGNHVIRYNHCFSEGEDHYFNDIIGGSDNGGSGNLRQDSDVYGNIASHAWDDGLSIEGYNINIRTWGNVIHHTMKAIATANNGGSTTGVDNSLGPHYIWRNLIFDANPPFISATKVRGNGGYFFYHNTIFNSGGLESPGLSDSTAVDDVQMVGIVKNNIMLSGGMRSSSEAAAGAPLWFFDYNLYAHDPSGALDRLGVTDWEIHGIFDADPAFDLEGDYFYYLAPGDPGVDAGDIIPNFTNGFTGGAPDMGAFERGVFPPEVTDCTNGNTEPCGIGACAGQRTCVDGQWSACDGATPVTEVCDNNVDDDCDGNTDMQDNNCVGCTNGNTEACGIGACAGQRTCVDGQWSACDGTAPVTEVCDNNLDDDCDGMPDSEDDDCVNGKDVTGGCGCHGSGRGIWLGLMGLLLGIWRIRQI